MALPNLTPEQRTEALAKAAQVRTDRALIKGRLKSGTLSLPEVFKDGETSDTVAKMKVTDLVSAMPGVGKVRAKQIMDRIGIDEKRRVRGLGALQRAALEQEFATADA